MDTTMNLCVDINNQFRGLGPAGLIIRIVMLQTIARVTNTVLEFSEATDIWWQSSFSSRFYSVVDSGVLEIPNISKCFKQVCREANVADREIALAQTAKEILIVNSDLTEQINKWSDFNCLYIRATDKITEAPYYPACLFKRAYEQNCTNKQLPIYLASDSEYSIKQLQAAFSEYELFISPTPKSKNEKPLHLQTPRSKKDLLHECLFDAYAMSKAKFLIYSHSMMINLANYLNPTLCKINVDSTLDEESRKIVKECGMYSRYLYLPKGG